MVDRGNARNERIDVPDKIACHVSVRTTSYLYRERIPAKVMRDKKKRENKKK